MAKNDLRVWGVWDPIISRLEYLSQSYGDCQHIIKLFNKAHRVGCEVVRFDLSPLYRDEKNKVFK